MIFNEAMEIVDNVLKSTGTTININEYDGVIVKKLEASNTLDEGRTTNQTHIAITGNQMDIFPYLRSEGYFNNDETDSEMKKYFVTQIPVFLAESNIKYLEAEGQESGIVFANGENKSHTSIVRSRRRNQADQIQVSLINFDGKDFIAFRRLLHANSYLIILKRKQKFEYFAFGIISNKGIEADGGLAQLNNQFYKLSTNTVVSVEELVEEKSESVEDETMLEKYKKFYLQYIEKTDKQEFVERQIALRKEFIEEYPLERLRTLSLNEYALGFKDSLSYKIEFGKYKHAGLGIKGGSSGKHGIYKGKDNKFHNHKLEVVSNPEELWNQLRNQIYYFLRKIGENNHPAIIEPEIFEMVRIEKDRRLMLNGKYSGTDILTSRIKCGECGGSYGAKVWHSSSKYKKVIYQCNRKYAGKEKCNTPAIRADDVEVRFVNAVNSIIKNKDEIISNLEMVLNTICNKKELSDEKEKLENNLTEQVEKIQELIEINSRVAQNQEKYKKEYDALIKEYEETKSKFEQLEIESSKKAAKHQMIKDYINTLKKQDKPLEKFDGLMWGSLLESATIKDKDTIVFKFKDGTEING